VWCRRVCDVPKLPTEQHVMCVCIMCGAWPSALSLAPTASHSSQAVRQRLALCSMLGVGDHTIPYQMKDGELERIAGGEDRPRDRPKVGEDSCPRQATIMLLELERIAAPDKVWDPTRCGVPWERIAAPERRKWPVTWPVCTLDAVLPPSLHLHGVWNHIAPNWAAMGGCECCRAQHRVHCTQPAAHAQCRPRPYCSVKTLFRSL